MIRASLIILLLETLWICISLKFQAQVEGTKIYLGYTLTNFIFIVWLMGQIFSRLKLVDFIGYIAPLLLTVFGIIPQHILIIFLPALLSFCFFITKSLFPVLEPWFNIEPLDWFK